MSTSTDLQVIDVPATVEGEFLLRDNVSTLGRNTIFRGTVEIPDGATIAGTLYGHAHVQGDCWVAPGAQIFGSLEVFGNLFMEGIIRPGEGAQTASLFEVVIRAHGELTLGDCDIMGVVEYVRFEQRGEPTITGKMRRLRQTS